MKFFICLTLLLIILIPLFGVRAIGYDISGSVTVNTLAVPINLIAVDDGSAVLLSWQSPSFGQRTIISDKRSDVFSEKKQFQRNQPTSMKNPTNAEFNKRVSSGISAKRNQLRNLLGYNIYRDGMLINNEVIQETEFYDSNIIPGTTYNYYVTAIYELAESFASNSVEISIQGFVYGDVNRDGSVTPLDAAIILQYYVGFDPIPDIDPIPWSELSLLIADVNLDGQVMPLDSAIILQYYVGIVDELPVQSNRNYRRAAAEVDVVFDGSFLKFFADNDLIAMSLEVLPEYSSFLCEPVFYSRDYMLAYNITNEFYKLAMVGAEPENGKKLVLTIPVTLEEYDKIELFLQINDQAEEKISVNTLDLDSVSTSVITALKGNYPNPFNPETTIFYSLSDYGNVLIDIYNIKGQKITNLVSEMQIAGNHRVVWNGTDNYGNSVTSGVYFVRMVTLDKQYTTKIMLMK